jgi:BMFP domain-containing protein YqiC
MVTKERVLDDLARVAGGTVSVLSDLGRNIREDIKTRADDLATRLDLVPREDFERLEAVLAETRKIVEQQGKQIAALEKQNKKTK